MEVPTREIAEVEQIARKRSLKNIERPNPISRTAKARVQIPVGRVEKFLINKRVGKKRSRLAAITLAAVLEKISTRICKAAAKSTDRVNIKRSDIQQAIAADHDLSILLASAIIPDCGKIERPSPVQPRPGWQQRRRFQQRQRRLSKKSNQS